MSRRFLTALLLSATLILTACDSAEERAEQHYQAGMALLEKGDVDRALVEFRNVFDLNGKHLQARLTYARLQRERGETGEAYSQYLRVAEQYPDNLEARLALSEMAIEANDWEEARRHGTEVVKLAPEDPMARAVGAVLDYQAAAAARDRAAGADPAARLQALMEANPDNAALALMAYRVLIDRAMTSDNPQSVGPVVDKALMLDPNRLDWQMIKLRLVVESQDTAAIGTQLNAMYDLFPGNTTVRDLLIAWHMQQKDPAGAEAFLRRLAKDVAGSGKPDAATEAVKAQLNIVQFLKQTRGSAAAAAELDSLIAAAPDNVVYRATRAALEFEGGDKDKALADLNAVLKDAPDTSDTRNVRVALARMLQMAGDAAGAKVQVDQVLASDPTHVAALKMRAAWQIEEDKPGDAIVTLRTALDQDPRDPEILTLMGQAHERDGARDLAGERYAAAVEASGRGVAETMRYAQFLLTDQRLDAALALVDDSLQANPGNPALLNLRAEVLLTQRNWTAAADTVAQLRALGTPDAIAAANRLDATLLLKQEKVDETIAFLDSLSGGTDAKRAALAAVVQAQVQAGDVAGARDYLDGLLAKTPDDLGLRFLRAGIHVLQDEPDKAEAIYRDLMAATPDDVQPFQALYKLLRSTNRADEAQQMLDAALSKAPNSVSLLLMKAGGLEEAGDFDGAIAIYETLYAQNSNSPVVANNLASLITNHRDDPASLERAFAIAHRLRGTNVPAFQDTYGWIEYRRGNFDEALANLEPAARALTDDPMVQLHLGMTYAALKRTEEARSTLARALDLAQGSALPAYEAARKTLADLGGAP